MAFYRCMTNSGGGGDTFEPSTDGIQFNNEIIKLPITLDANHRIKVEFYIPNYINNMNIVGNTSGNYDWFNLTQWQNAYGFASSRGDGVTYSANASLTGWHSFDFNNNSKVLMDNDYVLDGQGDPLVVNPLTNAYNAYTIGYRRDTADFIGKIKRFTIWDNTDDSLVCDLQAYGKNGDADCLYDVVNDKFYVPYAR